MRVDVPTCDRPAARCTDSIRVAIATDADDHAANLTGWSRPMTIGAGPVPRHFARILHRVAHAGLRGGDQPRCAAKLPGVERRVLVWHSGRGQQQSSNLRRFSRRKGESIGCSSKVAVGGMTSRSRLPIRTICVGSRDMSRLVVQALVTRRSIPMRNEKFATAIVRAAAEPRI
jgi:hypothetical protein